MGGHVIDFNHTGGYLEHENMLERFLAAQIFEISMAVGFMHLPTSTQSTIISTGLTI